MAAENRKSADAFAASLSLKWDADLMGRSYSEIARHLNEAGVVTATGRKFYPQTVKNYMKRVAPVTLLTTTGNCQRHGLISKRKS